MEAFSFIFSFVFGTIVGSFLNVVAIRFQTGAGIGGRSKCMSCAQELGWVELVPLFSFFLQKGVCRKCKSKISWQYPLVEFLAGALFVLILIAFPPTSYVRALSTLIQVLSACLLMVIAVHDIRHKIIPDQFVYAFGALALINLFVGGHAFWHMPNYENLIAGPLIALPFALLWLVSKGTWMGLGDAKLALGIGWFLGVNGGINAVILAFWIGAAVSVIWLFVTKKGLKPKTEIPFGPYLIIGMYIVMIFGMQAIDIGIVRETLGLSM